MTRIILRLVAAALLLAPMTIAAAQAQQSSLDRDPADSRIQGTVQPMTPMGSAGNRPVGRAIGRIGGNDEWADRGGETSRSQEPARRPSALGNSGLPPSQGECSPTRTTSSARSAAIRLMAEHGDRRADPAIERIFEQPAGLRAHRYGPPIL